MIGSLLALAAGFLVFFLVLLWLERDVEVRQFWTARIVTALILGLALWKLTPIWTRWETVFSQPLLLLSMNGGLAAVLGGLFAFLTVAGLSLWQLRKERPTARRWPLTVPLAAGLLIVGGWTLLEPVLIPRRGEDPGIELQTLVPDLAGQNHALADWKGRVVVVNFWATWCAPCLAELPELRTFAQNPSDRVALVGVNLVTTEAQGLAEVIRVTSRQSMSWTQLTDPEGTLQKAYGVTVIPTTVVLDPDGRVVDRREGPVDLFWLRSLEARFAR